MARIVIIGRRSLLAESFQRHLLATGQHDVAAFAHDEEADLDGADACINFAFHPDLRTSEYRRELNVDLAIARRLPLACRYVMPSSRLVYGGEWARGSRPTDPAQPSTPYGSNKLWIEMELRQLLGDRLTILRIPNPLIYRAGHPQFVSRLIDSLKADGEVRLDISPFTRKDFVPERYLMSAIATACVTDATAGTFNVGSGQGVEVGRIALWVIDGYGSGQLVVTAPRVHDEFWLDMSRSEPVFGPAPSRSEINKACFALGRSIAP